MRPARRSTASASAPTFAWAARLQPLVDVIAGAAGASRWTGSGAAAGVSGGAEAATVETVEDPDTASIATRTRGTCEVCGNDYDKAFEILQDGRRHVFDCFECAVHALAPRCSHCSCRILGHGMESDGAMFCCAHCAEASGVAGMKDRT